MTNERRTSRPARDPRGGPSPRPSSGGPRREGGSGGGYDRGPRPASSGGGYDRGPRPASGGGGYNRGPRPEGGSAGYNRGPRPASSGGSYDRGPRPASSGGSYDRGPRPASSGGSYDRGPRPASSGGSYDRGPRPASSGGSYDRGPRPASSGGSYDRGPRPASSGGSYDRGPRPAGGSGGYNRGPRPEGGSGGYNRGPRPEGGSGGYNRGPRPASSGGSYDRGPRPSSSGGSYDRGPRPSSSGGSYDRGPRPSSSGGSYDRGPRPSSSGGSYDRGPRPASSGGYNRGPRPEGGSSGGYNRGPRPEGGGSGGYNRGPRPASSGGSYDRGPRPRPDGGFSRGPRPSGGSGGSGGGYDRGPRPASSSGFNRGPRPAGSAGFDRGPRREEGGRPDSTPEAARRVRWRRDGTPSPATPPLWKKETRDLRNEKPEPFDEDQGGRGLPSDPREASLRILHAVDTRSAFSDRLLDGAHQRPGADGRDRALLHELVKGSLRWRGRLDWALNSRIHIGLDAVQPWIRNILRIGAYQILMLDRIPGHAAVDEAVKLAHKYGHPGSAGLVNGVLRRLIDEKETIEYPAGDDVESLSVWGSHPVWIVERWLERFGAEATRALMMANNRSVPTGLRVNALRGTRADLVAQLAEEGVESRLGELSPDLVWVEGHHSPGALKAFKDGWCTAQDESEALVGRVVAPEKHDRILDMCAAPGGKSTHMAELIGDEGEVWALERDKHRVTSLEANIKRLGDTAIHVVHGDGLIYEFPMPFDRVLVDAPCSGLGVMGRRADARWRKGPEVLNEMPPVQLELLDAASYRVRPGGLLVYSVCTFEPEETDHVVERFLQTHPAFKLESISGLVPEAVVTPEGFMRVLPQRDGCDGSFAARFRKS